MKLWYTYLFANYLFLLISTHWTSVWFNIYTFILLFLNDCIEFHCTYTMYYSISPLLAYSYFYIFLFNHCCNQYTYIYIYLSTNAIISLEHILRSELLDLRIFYFNTDWCLWIFYKADITLCYFWLFLQLIQKIISLKTIT